MSGTRAEWLTRAMLLEAQLEVTPDSIVLYMELA